MAKNYRVRIRWAMDTYLTVQAENEWHAQQKAMETFDEDYDLNAPDPFREFVEREDVGEPVLVEMDHVKQTEA